MPKVIKKHKVTIDIWANFKHADHLVDILNETDGIEAELGNTARDGKRDIRISFDVDKTTLEEHFQ